MELSELELLRTVPAYHVQAMLRARRVKVPAGNEDEGNELEQIVARLFEPGALIEALSELRGLEKRLLCELVWCGGRANSRDLALYATYAGLLGEGNELEDARPGMNGSVQYPAAYSHGRFEMALHLLLLRGLIFWSQKTQFASLDYASGIHDGMLIVPASVKEAALKLWPPTKPLSALAEEQLYDVGAGARTLQRMLYLYWSAVTAAREGLTLLNNGLLARSALRYIVERVDDRTRLEQIRSETDIPYLLFVRLLLLKLGLLRVQGGTLLAAPARTYFRQPLLERARRCYQLALEDAFWNEIPYLPEVNVRPGPAPLEAVHSEILRSRQTVIERLKYEEVGEWITFPAFIAHMKLFAPYLLFPRQYGPRAERYSTGCNPYNWDFRLRKGWLTPREGWYAVEGGFIQTVVSQMLTWLGITELDHAEKPTRFRLLPEAALIMAEREPVTGDEIQGRLIVQPNFELVVLAPVSEGLLISLDRFAERIDLEHVARYRLSKASVVRAIQQGLNAEKITRFLETESHSTLPQNVAYSLKEWERQARRVELWRKVILLEVEDPAVLDELCAQEELYVRRLSSTLVEVLPERMQEIREWLWQRALLPAQTEAPAHSPLAGEAGGPQWRLLEDGVLQPLYPVVDLFVAAEAERFCEQHKTHGGFCLTPDSVRQALKQGMELEGIIRFLQRYCLDGIPGSLLPRLKLWGDGYSASTSIYLEQGPLLRLPEQVLQDLHGDEQVSALLGPTLEPEYRFVRISPSNLERLRALLRERGFALDEFSQFQKNSSESS
uniref:Helicase XPB/Ssl2 N-terminal domain-containing protein n=1 Tax=Thermosporothrix sp. COM3 TaxID=2490863 RepID=A0A455SSY6_9CHLR|nr:hypothetical protein KTC_40060 [Thermosporothrix sp. COM3]